MSVQFSITLILLCTLASFIKADKWAVLVAGSNGFYNYRHQSDLCHAYQTLISKGFNPKHIITLAYDDIAYDPENPFQGKVFNKPSFEDQGKDVYKGCKLDYTQDDVNPLTFQAVLTGNTSHVTKNGTKRVLNSTSNDTVFLSFFDHGATGLIAFPNDYFYADQLLSTFKTMYKKKMYKKLVFYLEACESGSMFVNLPKNQSIYAVSAAGIDESSWANYCSPGDVIANVSIGSCLGDTFSTNWMENSDSVDINKETLQQQYLIVKNLTTQSAAMQWGDINWTKNFSVGNFIGTKLSLQNIIKKQVEQQAPAMNQQVESRKVKLHYLLNKNRTEEANQEFDNMNRFDTIFKSLAQNYELGSYSRLDSANQYIQNIDYDCLRNQVNHFEKSCGKFSDYGLQYIKVLAQSCSNQELLQEQVQQTITQLCSAY